MRNVLFGLLIAITIVLGFTRCDDDDVVDFGDAKFIGDWSVIILLQSIPPNSDSTYILDEAHCDFTFLANGQLKRLCDTTSAILEWYYREQPKKIVLISDQVVFSNVFEYDIVKCEQDFQEWEVRNISGSGFTRIYTVLLTRK